LLQHQALADATNQWKLTPLAIAMLKGHFAIAELLLSQEGVDVNIRNDQVRHEHFPWKW